MINSDGQPKTTISRAMVRAGAREGAFKCAFRSAVIPVTVREYANLKNKVWSTT